MLNLGVRDLKPQKDQHLLSDLSPRQISYAAAGSLKYVVLTDLLEIGGETDAGHARITT